MLRWAGWLVIGTLLSSAAYELALALGAGSLGPEPGDGVAGSGIVKSVALLAMLAAAVLGAMPGPRPWPAALFGPFAAAFLVTFFFTYDAYYLPTLRRYSDSGGLSLPWLVIVVAVALADGALTARQPQFGRVMTPIVLVVVLLTTLFVGTGH
jgi:hypothetical protein